MGPLSVHGNSSITIKSEKFKFLKNILKNILFLKPWLNSSILFIEIIHIRNQIFYNIHMRQWIDFNSLRSIQINFAIKKQHIHSLTTFSFWFLKVIKDIEVNLSAWLPRYNELGQISC